MKPDFRPIDFYRRAPPPPAPLRVWAKNPGQEAHLYEVESMSQDPIRYAITSLRAQGYQRAVVEVK